jgi:hypothetical protein
MELFPKSGQVLGNCLTMGLKISIFHPYCRRFESRNRVFDLSIGIPHFDVKKFKLRQNTQSESIYLY